MILLFDINEDYHTYRKVFNTFIVFIVPTKDFIQIMLIQEHKYNYDYIHI